MIRWGNTRISNGAVIFMAALLFSLWFSWSQFGAAVNGQSFLDNTQSLFGSSASAQTSEKREGWCYYRWDGKYTGFWTRSSNGQCAGTATAP